MAPRAWALFEGAIGKPVEVIKEKSIINGDDQCKFRVIQQVFPFIAAR
jgi:hypothetical protein